jgi:hypothetical protein
MYRLPLLRGIQGSDDLQEEITVFLQIIGEEELCTQVKDEIAKLIWYSL